MTTSELITASLQRLGVIDADETPTGTEMNDALDRLNDLIDAWGTERLSMYTSSRTTWTITSGTAAYAIGPGSVVNRARPVYVDDIRFIDTSQDPDLEMPLSPPRASTRASTLRVEIPPV